jgi:hypothetical protein
MTTVLPVLFEYCYRYCYSDSRKLLATTLSLYIFTICKSIIYNLFCRDGIYFDKILVSKYKLFKRSNKANLFITDMYVVITIPSLEVKETTDTASSAWFLDLYLEFDDSGQISTKIYDKRDDFNFKIINIPNMCSNIEKYLWHFC